MSKIDIDKFVEHLVKWGALDCIAVQSALFEQGLTLCNYEIQKIGENSLTQVEVEKNQESEDEKVRKELIKHLKELSDWKEDEVIPVKNPSYYRQWASWLEKQGEPIDKIVKRAMNEKQRVLLTETNGDANIDWDTRSLQDVKLLLEYGLDYIRKLEKQGEQKLDDKDNWEYIQDFIGKIGHFPKDSDELDVLINYVLSKKRKFT